MKFYAESLVDSVQPSTRTADVALGRERGFRSESTFVSDNLSAKIQTSDNLKYSFAPDIW